MEQVSHWSSLSICEKMRFAGIIVASTELGTDRVYANEVIPVVYVNRMLEDQFRILPDDRYGVELAMQYLKKMGHTDIGFINGPESSIHSGIRFRTYLEKCMSWIPDSREVESGGGLEDCLRL